MYERTLMKNLSLFMLLSCLVANANDETFYANMTCDKIADLTSLKVAGLRSEEDFARWFERFYACAQENPADTEDLLAWRFQPHVTGGEGIPRILKKMQENGFKFSKDFLTRIQIRTDEYMSAQHRSAAWTSIQEQTEQKKATLRQLYIELDTQAEREKEAQNNVIVQHYKSLHHGSVINCESWSHIGGKVDPKVYELCALHNSFITATSDK